MTGVSEWITENPGVTIAIIALVSSATAATITALLAPLINSWVKRREDNRKEKRELIASWRRLVGDLAAFASATGVTDVTERLITRPDFLSLEPHMEISLRSGVTIEPVLSIGPKMAKPLDALTQEINRIEKKWRL